MAWFVIYAILRLTPVDDADVFTQIRLGLDGSAIGSLSYLLTGSETPNPGWLAQKVLAVIYSSLGWEGLQAVRAAMYATAILVALSAVETAGRAPSPLAVLAASLFAFLVMLSNATLRPQMFAALCFALTYRLAGSRTGIAGSAVTILVLGSLWQNLHPSVPSGIALVGCLFVGQLFAGDSVGRSARLVRLALLVAVLAACQVLTPLGASIFEISTANLRVSAALGVSEWMPAWHPSVRHSMWPFFVALAGTAVAVARSWRRLPSGPLIATASFAIFSLASARFALFFALAACPLWLAALDAVSGENESRGAIRPAAALVLACALGASASIMARSLVSPLADSRAPVAAVYALRESLTEGRVYNYREWAGPLHLLGNRGWKTALDGRLYLFGPERWREYVSEALGEVPLEEIEARHAPDAFFLHPGFHSRLIRLVRESGRWRVIHGDEMAVVIIREEGDADA